MNLIDENEEKEQVENKQKIKKIIIFSIAILILIVISLVVFSTLKKKNTLKLNLDGDSSQISSGLILMTDNSKDIYFEDGHMYFSIRKFKELVGNVEIFNDEYKNKGEDATKCHIKVGNEYTSFISNSDQIYKAVVYEDSSENTNSNKNNNDTELITEYEYFTVEKPVKNIDGELYASDDAIELGFNVNIYYDSSNKTIAIYTLNGLETIANDKVKTNTAVIGDDCDYSNKKLLRYGLILVQNSEGNYGIANYETNKEIMTCTYSNIRFSESTQTVVATVAKDNLQGIFKLDLNNQTAETKIKPMYQLIRQIDEDLELYVVKNNEKYGVIKISGDSIETILPTEYEQIGLDDIYENMDNKYIIKGNKKYIPIKIDGKWGVVTTDGKKAIYTQYEGIGCTLGDAGNPVIILPDLVEGADAIVCKKITDSDPNDSKSQGTTYYKLVNTETREEFGYDTSEIYSKYEEGEDGENKTVYYIKLEVNGTVVRNIDIYQNFGKKSQAITNQDDVDEKINNANNTTNTTNTTVNNTTNTTENNTTNSNNSNTTSVTNTVTTNNQVTSSNIVENIQ